MRFKKRVSEAGLEILEARITYLAYAPEIAAVMLQRQQASAIIDARKNDCRWSGRNGRNGA